MASHDPDINVVGRKVFLLTVGSALAFAAAAYLLI
jgi:hypothetical protein